MTTYSTKIRPSYQQLRVLYIGVDVRRESGLQQGELAILHAEDPDFSVSGKLDGSGYISGIAKLYNYLKLQPDMVVNFDVTPDGSMLIREPSAPNRGAGEDLIEVLEPQPTLVFERMGLRHVHFEPFSPENLRRWQPETETDVYLVFGVLQDFTDYQYCCGASKAVLEKVGADYSETAKPDAILVDRTTGQYVMAEWKKYSSEFKLNHAPQDVDVVVCWEDDETNRAALPPRTLPLRTIAQTAAKRLLTEGA